MLQQRLTRNLYTGQTESLTMPLSRGLTQDLSASPFNTYLKTDRALDLGNLAPFTIPDLSGNANTATQYSGIYVSTNGTTDNIDFGNVSFAEPVTSVTCKARSGTDTSVDLGIATGTIVANGLWQDVAVAANTKERIDFDGVDDFVRSTTVPNIASSTVTITLEYTANEAQFIELQSASAFHLVGTLNSTLNGSNDLVVASDNSNLPNNGAIFRYNGLTVGDVITIVLNIDATYQITSATVNGASMTTAGSGSSRQEASLKTTLRFGRRTDNGFAYAGYFTNFSVSTDSTYDWDGTVLDATSKGWTIGGSPDTTSIGYLSEFNYVVGATFTGDLSDIALYGASGTLLHRAKLYDSADASLDGYPALDCVGGFHGTYTGCASGSGEGVDADVAGISATLDDYMWFDGLNDYVELGAGNLAFGSSDFEIEADIFISSINGTIGNDILTFYDGVNNQRSFIFKIDSSGVLHLLTNATGLGAGNTIALGNTALSVGERYTVKVVKSGSTASFFVDGASDGSGSAVATLFAPTLLTKAAIGIGLNQAGPTFRPFHGIIYDLSVISGGAGVHEYLGNGNTDAAWVDQIGSNNGTVNGNPVTVGQKRETILQTAGEDFNKRMWFDGVDDNIDFGAGDALSFHGSAKVEYRGYIYVLKEAPLVSYTVFSTYLNVGSVGFSVAISAANTLRVSGRSSLADSFLNLTTAISEGWHYIKCYADYANDQLGISIDNAAYITSVAAFASSVYTYNTSTQRTRIGDASGSAGTSFIGIIHDSEILLDDTPISLTGGTVNGSPSLYHVAESETTAGIDALGNAITNPRPNERVLNLTTGTGYATVADNDSLDLTTAATWELWGNFYELFSSSESLLSKWSSSVTAKRSWIVNGNNGAELNRVRLAISANGSTVSWIGYVEVPDSVISLIFTYNGTIVTGYVNGASVTVTTTFGSIPASMHVGTAPLSIGTDNDSGTMLLRQIGDIRIYDRALTADEVLKNYNARKSAYGL